jgi:drug/metabolite transporter (DMT)-like permease
MLWFPLLFVGIIAQVSRTIFVKKVGDKVNPVFATFGRFLFIPVFSGIFLLFYGFKVDSNWFYLYSILGGILFGISQIFVTLSLVKNNASITTAVWKTNIILTLLLEVIFLGEKFLLSQVLGVVVILIGVVMVAINKDKKLNFWESIKSFEYKYLAIGWFIYPFANILQRKAVLASNPAVTTFVNNLSSVVATFVALILFQIMWKLPKIDLPSKIKANTKDFVLMGVFGFVSIFAANYATQFLPVTIVSSITQLEILFTMIYAYYFLGEKQIIRKNILPLLLLVVGIVLVIWK